MNLNNVIPINRLTQIRLSSTYPLEQNEFNNSLKEIINQFRGPISRILQKFKTISTQNMSNNEIYTMNANGTTTQIAKYTRVDDRKILYAFVVYTATGIEDYRVYLKSYFDTKKYNNVFQTLTNYIGTNMSTFENVLNIPNTIPDDVLSTTTVGTSPVNLPPQIYSVPSSAGSTPANSPGQPSTSQIAQNLQNIMPNQPTPGQQQAPSGTLTPPITRQQTTSTSISNPPANQMSTQASSLSSTSISTLRETTDQQVLDRLKDTSNATFDIKNDLEDFNDYVLSQVAKKQAINYDTVQAVRRKYPFIMTDEYERNILGYNGIINTGIVSNIPVNFKDLVLPIPSYTQNIPDQKDKQVQLNLKQAIDRGYQIVSSKDGFKNDYITFKQKEGQNKFVGSYIHPKLKGKFRVRYEGKNNTFVISNPNYPTGYVKTGFQIYSYLNSLLKKQEKESQKPFVYMPRIAVAYQ